MQESIELMRHVRNSSVLASRVELDKQQVNGYQSMIVSPLPRQSDYVFLHNPDRVELTRHMTTVSLERDGHVLVMGLNRPEKRNSFNIAMLADLSRAYALLESDDTLRAGVLFAHGDHFTSGLDLVDVGPSIAAGQDPFPDDGRDPWRLDGEWTKPVVAAAQGWCLTLGIELLLAADIRIAAAGTRFAQLEVLRGIYPFGGATIRLPRRPAGAMPCAGC